MGAVGGAINVPHREHISPFVRILVPVDGSDASIAAARVAIQVAAVHQLPMIALYVVDDKTVTEVAAMSGDAEDTVRRQLEAKGYSYLEHVARMAKNNGVGCERMVRRGIPHAQVADLVRDLNVDLIVMGAPRTHAPRRALSGSLTEHVIAYVPCSVLVVKSE